MEISGIIRVDPKTGRLVDDAGRERLFHGTNVVYKGPPYLPLTEKFDPHLSFSEQDMQDLENWGLNVIRLGVMWPGVEPKPSQYNSTYLGIAQWIVDTAGGYGIYSLLDMHQDCFSEKFCGEGVPEWAAIPSNWTEGFLAFPEPLARPYAVNASGIPSQSDCNKKNWAEYQFTVALSSAVQNLYKNYKGLADAFGRYWRTLANLFSKSPWVIGYELMNEPWAGDIFEDPALMVPGVADRLNLQPFYDKIASYIHSVDEDHMIFFESVTWDDILCGFTEVPGGADYKNRSVLSYHFYQPPNLSPKETIDVRNKEIKRLGCGGFLTEFDSDVIFDDCDANYLSWMNWEFKSFFPITGWEYGFYYANGSLNVDAVKKFSRSYAKAVAGSVQQMSFNHTSGDFFLSYLYNQASQLPTEIYFNQKYHYPQGFTVTVTPSTAQWQHPFENTILIVHSPNMKDKTPVNVFLRVSS